jgi:hypothetical protein
MARGLISRGLQSAMQCNIDARGKRVRLISGVIVALIGVVMLAGAAGGALTGGWPWGIGLAALLGGGFQIFEGWAGWCALRAMGFKTKM